MKGIVVASVGTSNETVFKNSIDEIKWELKEKYPEHYIINGVGSDLVRRKLAEENKKPFSIPGALLNMEESGIRDVTILSLFATRGTEFEKIEKQTKVFNNNKRMNIRFTGPLIDENSNIDKLADAFEKEFSEKATILLGNENIALTEVYAKLKEKLSVKNIYLIEEENLDEGIKTLENLESKDIRIISLLGISKEEVDDDKRDTLVSNLANLGFKVEIDKRGLSEFKSIRDIYYEKLADIV